MSNAQENPLISGDICLIHIEGKSRPAEAAVASFARRHNPEATIWVASGVITVRSMLRKSGMRVSDIPSIVEPDESDIACPVSDAVLDGSARPAASFLTFGVPFHASLDDLREIFAAICATPAISGDAVLVRLAAPDVGEGLKVARSACPPVFPGGPSFVTVADIREGLWLVEKRLRYHLARNTVPLVMSDAVMDARRSAGMPSYVPMNAADVQTLFAARNGEDIAPCMRLRGDPDGSSSRLDMKAASGVVALTILSQMHPSARDPKFTERSERWIARWPESRDEAYRWIRTWSGRLRRAQAKAWKARTPVSSAGGR